MVRDDERGGKLKKKLVLKICFMILLALALLYCVSSAAVGPTIVKYHKGKTAQISPEDVLPKIKDNDTLARIQRAVIPQQKAGIPAPEIAAPEAEKTILGVQKNTAPKIQDVTIKVNNQSRVEVKADKRKTTIKTIKEIIPVFEGLRDRRNRNIISELRIYDKISDEFNIEIIPERHKIKKLRFKEKDISLPEDINIKIDEIPVDQIKEKQFVEAYAIDPTKQDFTEAEVTATAKGNALYKCREWDFDAQKCNGKWVLFKTLIPGQEYTFRLTHEDPGFGEFIEIIKAVHLDENKIVISDIYDDVYDLDGNWSEKIYENEYVRVAFEENISAEEDITFYARNSQGLNTYVEIYHYDSEDKIAEFPAITQTKYYKILLTGMEGEHDTFDLKIVNADNETAYLEFDHIIDPSDTTPPVINWVNDGPDSLDPGQLITITANVTDNFFVDSAWVEIEGVNYTMIQGDNITVTKWTENFASNSDWATWGSGIEYVNTATFCINDENDDCLRGHGSGSYTLYKQSDIDLGNCLPNTAYFYIEHIVATGDLEADDCMEAHFSNNSGSSWSGDYNIFCNDDPPSTKNITIPNEYLTANFSIAIERESFESFLEYTWLDNLKVVCIVPSELWTLVHNTTGEHGLINYTVYANDTSSNNATPVSSNYTANWRPTPPTSLTCNGISCNNNYFAGIVDINCSGAADNESDAITYNVWAYYDMPGASDITFDDATSATGTGTLSWSHTIGNYSNRILIVGAAGESSAGGTAANTCRATGVTYGGDSLTKINGIDLDDSGADDCISLWYMLNPPVGTANIQVTYAGTVTESNAGGISIYNAKQQAPENSTTKYIPESQSPTSIATNITTLTNGSLVIDAAASGNSGGFTANSGQTERWDVGGGGSTAQAAGSTKSAAAAGLTSMGWSQAANRLLHALAAFAPATSSDYGWHELGNHSDGGALSWNTTELEDQKNVDIRCRAIDDGSLRYSDYYDPTINLTIDNTPPEVILEEPAANYVNTSAWFVNITFNCSATDNMALSNISLYITNSSNQSFSLNQTTAISGTGDSAAWILELGLGNYTWNCIAHDKAGNHDWSDLNRTIIIDLPDFTPISLTFSNNTPVENQDITIFAAILNIGYNFSNIPVKFFNGGCSNGTQINGNITIEQLEHGQNKTINVSHVSIIGPNNIYVCADPDDIILEKNETNNILNTTMHVPSYQYLYGQAEHYVALQKQTAETQYSWIPYNGTIYATDIDGAFDSGNLQALGRNAAGGASSNDFEEADANLGMAGFNDSIISLWADDSSTPKQTTSFLVHGLPLINVPYISSTNNSNYITGILWDTSTDTNGEYDETDRELLVFVSHIRDDVQGKYGVYDYEIKVPALMRSYYNSTDEIMLYLESR
jgi:hypothetical protein